MLCWSCNPSKDSSTNQSSGVDSQEEKVDPQELIGAWQATYKTDSNTIKLVTIVADGYLSTAGYDNDTNAFLLTYGGAWKLNEGKLVSTYEYATQDTSLVGETRSYAFSINHDTITFDHNEVIWTRIDDGTPGELSGAWLITGRKRDGEIRKRDTDRPRKTMKILSGTRFQWIAYNTATREFMGTGGGTYTTGNGKYEEHIEFFSRDNSRVGASLEFDYKLEDGDWHHSGLSSKGDPIYEIWSLRE